MTPRPRKRRRCSIWSSPTARRSATRSSTRRASARRRCSRRRMPKRARACGTLSIEERSGARARIAAAQATLQTRRRLARAAPPAAFLAAGWQQLPGALATRWRSHGKPPRMGRGDRRAGTKRACRKTHWRIVHPPDGRTTSATALAASVAKISGAPPTLRSPTRRFGRPQASPPTATWSMARCDGLLADRAEIGARLLQALERGMQTRPRESRDDPLDRRSRASAPSPRGRLRCAKRFALGHDALLGEVVRIDGDEIVVQVYEDTTGLSPRHRRSSATGSPARDSAGTGAARQHLRRPAATAVGARTRRSCSRECAARRRRTFIFTPRIASGATATRRARSSATSRRRRAASRKRARAARRGRGFPAVVAAGEYGAKTRPSARFGQADGSDARARDAARLAGARAAAGRASPAAARAARHRSAHHRLPVSRGAGRQGRRSRAASAPARPCSSKRSRKAATPTSSSTSAAASAATRWPACSTSFRGSPIRGPGVR